MGFSVKELAHAIHQLNLDEALGLDNEEVEELAEEAASSDMGFRTDAVQIDLGSAEYILTKDGAGLAEEYVKQTLEEEPELFTQSWLQHYMYMRDMDKRILAGELAESVHDLDDEDALERAEMGEDEDPEEAREKLYDEYYEDYLSELNNDAVGYLMGEFGWELSDLIEKGLIVLDEEKAATDAVATDGAAHFLSSYDGNQIDLERIVGARGEGFEAYRTN
jgi:hypothetical protein